MSYYIEQGLHSADKDHTAMTGGTLTVDKKVISPEGITFYTYSIPFFRDIPFDAGFHKGVHTAEHLLAYKKDTGSVRNSLEEVSSGNIEGKVILDISPYKTSENTFGFRVTSMIPLNGEQIQEFTKISVERAIAFLQSGQSENPEDFFSIPFARQESCGQFDFHDKQRAIEDLQGIDLENLEVQEDILRTKHTTAYVCDLRFLKPKLKGADDMVMFTPDFSYKISQLIELYLPEKLPDTITIVGTFGCMTGMYLCISSPCGDTTDITIIHAKIIEILKEYIEISKLTDHQKREFETLLENYQKYAVK